MEVVTILNKLSAAKRFSAAILAFSILLAIVPAVQAKPAARPLYGAMDLEFNLYWPGPQSEIPDWVGTITFEGDDTEYGMAFFAIGSGKAFDDFLKGQVHFFEEIWIIYDYVILHTVIVGEEVIQWLEYGEVLLWGYDVGQTNVRNSKYHMNGNVEQAFGTFFVYEGRNVHMNGIIEWYDFGAPHYGPGTFRIN